MIDLENAQDAELSKGLADKLYDREMKQMVTKLNKHEKKMK